MTKKVKKKKSNNLKKVKNFVTKLDEIFNTTEVEEDLILPINCNGKHREIITTN